MSKSKQPKLTPYTTPLPAVLKLLEVTKSPLTKDTAMRSKLIKKLYQNKMIDLETANYLAE